MQQEIEVKFFDANSVELCDSMVFSSELQAREIAANAVYIDETAHYAELHFDNGTVLTIRR